MAENRLNVVQTGSNPEPASSRNYAGGKARRQEAQAYFDRLWLIDPGSMNPLRNCMERERLDRTVGLIKSFINADAKKVADLGCGSGVMTRMLKDGDRQIDAVDISAIALNKLKEQDMTKISPIQDYVPMTLLKDDAYDLVVCTELIADLQPNEYRLLISELVRLAKSDGHIVCSTALDIDSVDALQRFKELAETEIQIDKWILSYHRLYIRLKDFFEAPARFYRASRDPEYRLRQLNQRVSFSKTWFKINSHRVPGLFWSLVRYICHPVVYVLRESRGLMLFLEKLSRLLWDQNGISQAIFIGKRRPLFLELPPNEIPRETKHKKQLWE